MRSVQPGRKRLAAASRFRPKGEQVIVWDLVQQKDFTVGRLFSEVKCLGFYSPWRSSSWPAEGRTRKASCGCGTRPPAGRRTGIGWPAS